MASHPAKLPKIPKIPKIPASLLLYKYGWKDVSSSSETYIIVPDGAFLDYHSSESLKMSLLSLANGIENALTSRREDVDNGNIYRCLATPLTTLVTDFTKQQLVKEGNLQLVSISEVSQFLGHLHLCVVPWVVENSTGMGSEVCIGEMADTLNGKLQAVIVGDVFDWKTDSKLLRFFLSGSEEQLNSAVFRNQECEY